MALTSALFTGLSGLDVNQTKLQVVGNNIANANTVAFKSSRALFSSQFYVTDGAGGAPQGTFGGANPSQRGLGAQVAAIEKDFNPGSIESTGKNTDLAIEGDGFFVVKGTDEKYTRDGSFSLNSLHQLVNNTGDYVQGFGVDSNYNIVAGTVGNVTVPLGALTSAKETENAVFKGNLNANGQIATGASILTSQPLALVGGGPAAPLPTDLLTNIASASGTATALFSTGQVLTLTGKKGGRDQAPSTFVVTATNTLGNLQQFFQQGMGIFPVGANPGEVPDDLNNATPPPGLSLESTTGDPANTIRLVVTGNLGAENKLDIAGNGFVDANGQTPLAFADGENALGVKSDPTGESVHTSLVAYDSLGTPISVGVTAVFESAANTGNTWRFYAESADDTDPATNLQSGTLTFDSSGKLIASTGASVQIDRQATGAKTPMSVKLDFSQMTSLTSGNSELVMTHQDGNPIGTLNDFNIGDDGKITGSFTNGQTRTLGQVAIATFSNNLGLQDNGGNTYSQGANSGQAVIAAPMTLGAGSIRSGALEQSNVDLSKEFINMIIASTGFSAASRVISTSDQLITELLNSSR
ncbi:MAG: flgE [Phycisphaerales bacterium]|nr:flgE [Phycisphaerales bacterium]